MATVLSIAATEVLKTTRELLLKNAGHSVISILNLPSREHLEQIEKPDLAVLGHGFRGSDKRKMALSLNQIFPGLPILEMCFHSPEVPGADFILTDSPEHLLTAVQEVLAGRRVRGFIT